MSKPVSNDDVEDVLSSIRRLVSEDKRPLQKPKSKPVEDRLVLTPSLRVTEQEQPETLDLRQLTEETWEEPELPEEGDDAIAGVLESEVTATPEADAEVDTSWDDDEEFGDHSSEAFWDDDIETAAPLEEAAFEASVDDVGDVIADEEEVASMPDDEAAPTIQVRAENSKASMLTAKISALEAAGSIRQEWEPDEAGTDAYSGTKSATIDWEDDVELDATGARLPGFEKAVSEELEAEVDDAEPLEVETATETESIQLDERADDVAADDEPVAAQVDELETHAEDEIVVTQAAELEEPATEAVIADDEADLGDRSEYFEFKDDSEDVILPMEEADAPQAQSFVHATDGPSVTLDVEPTPQTDDADDGFVGFNSDDQVLDEDALRDLVSDIVREELQGALGERITRNVRKLVRREIHRALTAQELE
ncbi:hypothetical protein C1J03_07310 [Sulfitobacter sp. SK012]|uniref:hypothetical protein n=1 Tax=Sulfitobacter sp. SK012 TaxID=1389005 RepID=UPI000E0C847E|nr:hypothetical protein [Sulfitobacter sp. SK012]AXI45856.1 hypothetical protein C1J03_07310 [Sulfitobacter sp. SK012]